MKTYTRAMVACFQYGVLLAEHGQPLCDSPMSQQDRDSMERGWKVGVEMMAQERAKHGSRGDVVSA